MRIKHTYNPPFFLNLATSFPPAVSTSGCFQRRGRCPDEVVTHRAAPGVSIIWSEPWVHGMQRAPFHEDVGRRR